jgi:DNA-binding sugar fermentation-stimulating protein
VLARLTTGGPATTIMESELWRQAACPTTLCASRDGTIYFPEPLTQAAIVRRRYRFVIDVHLGGAVVGCHCPTTGRIGTLVLDGLPCLLSASRNPARATPYTVEAVSVDPPGTRTPAWIGINQNAANRFVEQALTHQMLPAMVTADTLKREQVLGGSRLDFLVNDTTYIEVKPRWTTSRSPSAATFRPDRARHWMPSAGSSGTSASSGKAWPPASARSC